ncbi:hypothetical protein NHX12_019492 [Muraenolepis orangiensis]|uniref:Heme-binding protein 1 n=1 Tax=Muraenolepis orangiensis TaxID=630683 RepID=A0A9Q0ITY3_9TELE|nr:hypothetical protein NHX12_019492 [Muraenolepis orangiensis]
MDRGGCQLSGGGGGGPGSDSGTPGMITLEDLESFSEDQLSDSGMDEEEGTAPGEADNDRLLHYWQGVARDMAEPIQQLTTNDNGRSNRERVPFSVLTHKEKCGELLYEKRSYEKANWACVTVSEDTYEQSICYGFMRLMRYICKQNSAGDFLGMTLPIVTVIHTDESQSVISRDVTVAYYLPENHQAQPPMPTDNEIVIEVWPAAVMYTRPFTGPTNEGTIIRQITAMAEVLDTPAVYANNTFMVASYTNAAHANRENEIWFMEWR